MRLHLLGTGTSQGIPVIGCTCPVCTSNDPHDQRLRTSAWLEYQGVNLIIDTGPDFRQQALRAQIPQVDAVLLTHHHNDHVAGLDDIRPYNFKQNSSVPLYGLKSTLQAIAKRFDYIFEEEKYPGSPELNLHEILADVSFNILGVPIMPLLVSHGSLPILGYQFGSLVYMTDIKHLPPMTMARVMHCEVLIINALHHQRHPSHLNLQEALMLIEQIKPAKAYLIHLSHHMGLSKEVQKLLPPGVDLGHDGLIIEI